MPRTQMRFAIAVASLLPGTALAETHIVLANDVSFDPVALDVAPGDTIQWQYNSGYPHTVTSGTACTPDGLFDAPLNSGNPSFAWTVPDDASGDITYFCQPHCAMGMTGTLSVIAGDGIIHVPADYATIPEAVSAATSGDSIHITAGTYDVDEPLELSGVSLIGETDADGAAGVTMNFVDAEPHVTNWGLICTAGDPGDDIQLTNLHITNAVTAIEITGCNPTITNCAITYSSGHNWKYDSGGIQIRNSAATISRCTFRGNSGRYGGGLQVYNPDVSDPLTLTDCLFESNHASNEGGAISCAATNLMLTGCTITGNMASEGTGGIDIGSGSTVTLAGTIVCGNDPAQIAGDWIDNGDNTVDDVCPVECTGDFDGNGEVGVDDLLTLLAAFQQSDEGDCDSDGDTDVDDVLILISAWGACP